MSALDVAKIISIGQSLPDFKMASAQDTMNDISMGIAYQMRAGDSWKKVDGDTMFLGIGKMSHTHELSEQALTSDASNFGIYQPSVTFPEGFHTSCDPNNTYGDMTVKVAALTSQMYNTAIDKKFGSYQMSMSVLNGNGSEISVSHLQNGIRIQLRKVTGTETGTHECVYYDHTNSTWSSEGVTKISEDSTFVICESVHLSDFASLVAAPSSDDGSSSGGDDDNSTGWIIAGVVVGGLILIGIVVIVIIQKRKSRKHENQEELLHSDVLLLEGGRSE
jgi:hypothetical protein